MRKTTYFPVIFVIPTPNLFVVYCKEIYILMNLKYTLHFIITILIDYFGMFLIFNYLIHIFIKGNSFININT